MARKPAPQRMKRIKRVSGIQSRNLGRTVFPFGRAMTRVSCLVFFFFLEPCIVALFCRSDRDDCTACCLILFFVLFSHAVFGLRTLTIILRFVVVRCHSPSSCLMRPRTMLAPLLQAGTTRLTTTILSTSRRRSAR